MIDCGKIKLVLWDLDDTFWEGTLSEGEVKEVPENLRLVKELTDRGIVNSVCSKNDREKALLRLERMGVRELFVFPSINWEPKGERIRELILDMKLRDENVLFLDDNPVNLNEARFYSPGLMTAGPEELSTLHAWIEETPASDTGHKRLASYRVLETKREARQKSGSNEEFLMDSNVKVKLRRDCEQELDRIAELIGRTNQLNYTKKRIGREETRALLADPEADCGCVTVRDKYGDYGIVGFFAVRGKKLEHFLFSCRTLGMGVEQYVYAALGSPELTVDGEVAVQLRPDYAPPWINQERELSQEGRQSLSEGKEKLRILMKGPCDLDSIFSFIEDDGSIETEFTYVSPKTGVAVEQISHTTHIVESITLSKEEKQRIIDELPFGDEKMYSARIFEGDYDVVCLSILTDCNLGVYRRKATGGRVAFLPGFYPLTDPRNWEKYMERKIYTSKCGFTKEFLESFSEEYEFEGILTPEQIIENLKFIRAHLKPETLLVLILGVEIPYERNTNPAYEGRHLIHRDVNGRIKTLVAENPNMDYIDINRFVKGQGSFYDQFNHFVPEVYYEMSKDLVRLVRERKNYGMEEKSRAFMRIETLKEELRLVKNKILGKKK